MPTLVKFFTGSYVPRVGYPYILAAGGPADNEYSGDGFLVIRKPPKMSEFFAMYAEVTLPMSANSLKGLGVLNPDEFVLDATKSHIEGRLLQIQLAEYDQSKNELT